MKTSIVFLMFFFQCIILLSQTPTWQWADRIKDVYPSTNMKGFYVNKMEIGKDGSIYEIGSFLDTITINGSIYVSKGGLDAILLKYDSLGNIAWFKDLGGASFYDQYKGTSLALDSLGNVYIAGYFQNKMDIDGDTLISKKNDDIFIVSYTPLGNLRWHRTIGGHDNDRSYGITISTEGMLYICGTTSTDGYLDTVDFDPGFSFINVHQTMFFAKYDLQGNFIYARRADGSSGAVNIIADNTGIYIIGDASNGTIFDNITINTPYFDLGYLAKYSFNGSIQWIRLMYCPNGSGLWGLSVDNQGGVYLSGNFLSSNLIFLGSAAIGSFGDEDGYFAKYDSSGNFKWANRIGWEGPDEINSVIPDKYGNVFITGSFYHFSVFDTDTLYGTGGGTDMFLACYDRNGNYKWIKQTGGNGYDVGASLACDNKGSVFVTSSTTSNPAIFGSISLPSGGALWGSVTARLSYPTTISDVPTIEDEIAVYPNPAQNEINIVFKQDECQQVEILDFQGRVVYGKQANSKNLKIPCENIQDGIYLLHCMLKNSNGLIQYSKKIQINHSFKQQ